MRWEIGGRSVGPQAEVSYSPPLRRPFGGGGVSPPELGSAAGSSSRSSISAVISRKTYRSPEASTADKIVLCEQDEEKDACAESKRWVDHVTAFFFAQDEGAQVRREFHAKPIFTRALPYASHYITPHPILPTTIRAYTSAHAIAYIYWSVSSESADKRTSGPRQRERSRSRRCEERKSEVREKNREVMSESERCLSQERREGDVADEYARVVLVLGDARRCGWEWLLPARRWTERLLVLGPRRGRSRGRSRRARGRAEVRRAA